MVEPKADDTVADITCVSFHAAKLITTGEGGAVFSHTSKIDQFAKKYRNHGIDKSVIDKELAGTYKYDVEFPGENYRLTDFQCELGMSQLKRINTFLTYRKTVVKLYNESLKTHNEIVPIGTSTIDSANHIYVVKLDPSINRDRVYEYMISKGIGVNVHYIPIHMHTYYATKYPSNCPNAETAAKHILTLPLFYGLSNKDTCYVLECLFDACELFIQ